MQRTELAEYATGFRVGQGDFYRVAEKALNQVPALGDQQWSLGYDRPSRRPPMTMQRPHDAFDAEDHKVYTAWLRRTLAVYCAVILFGIALVAVQSNGRMTNVAIYMGDAVAQASP